jgi:hypothetical protein
MPELVLDLASYTTLRDTTPGRGEVEAGLAVGECPDHPG